jgi:VRR-NUC domain
MLESEIQNRLIRKYEADGYFVLKIIKANRAGIFDLLLIDKTTCVASWVEVKAKNGKISPLQKLRARELRSFGCQVNFVTEGGEPFPEGEDLAVMDF